MDKLLLLLIKVTGLMMASQRRKFERLHSEQRFRSNLSNGNFVLYFLFNIKRQGVVKPPEFSFK